MAINKVGREIPDEILSLTGKQPYMRKGRIENVEYKKASTKVRTVYDPNKSKLVSGWSETIKDWAVFHGARVPIHNICRTDGYSVGRVVIKLHCGVG